MARGKELLRQNLSAEACKVVDELTAHRKTAIALVYQHLANQFAKEAMREERVPSIFSIDTEYVETLRERADHFFGESQRSDPRLRDVYVEYGQLLESTGQQDRADSVYAELGRRFSDDVDALLAIGQWFHQQGEPDKARRYVQRAHELKPRDGQVAQLMWETTTEVARQAVAARQFELASQELETLPMPPNNWSRPRPTRGRPVIATPGR